MKTPLRQLSRADHAALVKSGMLWELYPDATGRYEEDTRPMNLSELAQTMRDARQTFAREDACEVVSKLYCDKFDAAIMAEGFTAAQAGLINQEAYERGHSAGYEEVVNCAMDVCDFAKRLLAAK